MKKEDVDEESSCSHVKFSEVTITTNKNESLHDESMRWKEGR